MQFIERYAKDKSRNFESIPQRIDDYDIHGILGIGGMGLVFRATHRYLKRNVAIKMLLPNAVAGIKAVERFRREVELIGALSHHNIVQALDAGEWDGQIYLVTELIDGIDIGKLVQRSNQLNVPDACEIARQAALGLQYIHDQGLVHRDVKPSNLILSITEQDDPVVKVMDLGLASLDPGIESGQLTEAGELMGTLEFMAPEQATDSRVDKHADIYSLGATLFRMLSGQLPYPASIYGTPVRHLEGLTSDSIRSIQSCCDELPVRLARLVDQMLSREATQRPNSMAWIAKQLEEFSSDHHLREFLTCSLDSLSSERVDAQVQTLANVGSTDHSVTVQNSDTASSNTWFRGGNRLLWSILICVAVIGLWFRVSSSINVPEDPVDITKTTLPTELDNSPDAKLTTTISPPPTKLANWVWAEPTRLSDRINSPGKDDQPTLSGDNLRIIFSSYCLQRLAGEGDRDLWLATRPSVDSDWGNVSNLGVPINTHWKEMQPSLLPNGDLIFASNRPGGAGDTDLWFASSSASNGWERPINIRQLNSHVIDDNPEVSTDGLVMFFSSKREGGLGDKDLWMSTRESLTSQWNQPEVLPSPINTEWLDSEPALSPDQQSLVFTSTRPGGFGGRDLWVCNRDAVNKCWTEPMNLGASVNSEADETHAAWSPDGRTLLFSSNRGHEYDATDLWVTRLIEPSAVLNSTYELLTSDSWTWTEAQELLSTFAPGNRKVCCVSGDGQTLYLAVSESGFDDQDLWKCYALGDNDWTSPVRMQPPLNSARREFGPFETADGRFFVFHSNREGSFDIWMSQRENRTQELGVPVKLSNVINTDFEEFDATLSTDGLNLIFASRTRRLQSSSVILESRRKSPGHRWGTPKPVNFSGAEWWDTSPFLCCDARILLFRRGRGRNRSGHGSNNGDIWMSTRPTSDSEWDPPTQLGPEINTETIEESPTLTADGKTLYFSRGNKLFFCRRVPVE